MSNINIHPNKAQRCIEHILYEIPAKTLHNIAAMLAQKHKKPVETFGNAHGNWTWPVLEYLLHERGMKCTKASNGTHWLIDSPTYLKQSDGFLGFIDIDTLDSWTYKSDSWTGLDGPLTQEDAYSQFQRSNTMAIHKMWTPLIPFYQKNIAFHITTDDSKWTRHECQPSSLWRPETVSYEKRDAAVKSFMKTHKKSPILMSNSDEMVLARPSKQGWKTMPILSYESINLEDASQQVAETLADKLVTKITQEGGWSIMAHALFSAYHYLGGSIRQHDCSSLTEEERNILEKYANGLYKRTSRK